MTSKHKTSKPLILVLVTILLVASVGLALVVFSGDSRQSFGLNQNVLHLKEYISRDGRWRLGVDPTHMNGCYEGNYSMVFQGKVLWERQLDFTFWDARICNDGHIVGYAYSQGVDGIFGPGKLIVAVIDTAGVVVFRKEHDRVNSRFLHAPPNPMAAGLEIDGSQTSFLLRLRDPDLNRRRQTWFCYDIPRRKLRSKTLVPLTRPIMHVRPIPETHFWIVQYWVYSNGKIGTAFAVCDSLGRAVWSLQVQGDYEQRDKSKRDVLIDRMWREGAIVESDLPHQFQLLFWKKSEIVTFKLSQNDDKGWSVDEERRTKQSSIIATPAESTDQLVHLPYLGELKLELKQPDETHPVRLADYGFAVDEDGRFGFVRHEHGKYEFVVVDGNENLQVEFELDLNMPQDVDLGAIASVGEGRFVLAASKYGAGGGDAHAWVVNTNDQTSQKLEQFRSKHINQIVGLSDGRFLVLSDLSQVLILYSSTGTPLTDFRNSTDQSGDALSMESIAVNSIGEICVLDNIRNTVLFFDDSGTHLRTLNLTRLWGYKPNYLSGIAGTINNGIVVHDFHGRYPLVHVNADGSVVNKFDPRSGAGRKTLHVGDDYCTTPDGRIWLADGPTIVRVDANGIVGNRLGSTAKLDTIGKIAAIKVDRSPQFYVQSSRTGAVKIFDADGRYVRMLHHPMLLDYEYSSTPINVTEYGSTIICNGSSVIAAPAVLQFDRAGRFIRQLHPPDDLIYYQPIRQRLLCDGFTQVLVASLEGEIEQRIRRHADRSWLERVYSIAAAPDGSFAIRTFHSGGGVQTKVSIFDPDGQPKNTINVDERGTFELDYNGRFLAVGTKKGALLFMADGTRIGRFEPLELAESNSPQVTFANAGQLIVAVDITNGHKIHRYDSSLLLNRH